jgi:two-component system response regulator YesN
LFEVAQSLRLNPQYFSRLFHQRMGRPVGKYIAQRKMDLARERLCTTNLSLKEIAHSLGFHDPLYFSRVFRRVIGCSPREYGLRHGL